MNTMSMESAMSSATHNTMQAQAASLNNLSGSNPNDAEKRKKLQEAAEGFEALFIQQMWEEMRSSLPKDGLLASKEEEFWQGMYDQELGKHMASAGGIGLADMMVNQLDAGITDVPRNNKGLPNRNQGLQIAPAPMFDIEGMKAQKAAEKAAVEQAKIDEAAQAQAQRVQAQEAPMMDTSMYSEAGEDIAGQQIAPPKPNASEVVANAVASTIANSSAPQVASKAENEALAEPVVTRVTYQTNSTTNQAQRRGAKNEDIVAAILADARSAYREHLNEQVKAQNIYQEMPNTQNQTNAQMMQMQPQPIPAHTTPPIQPIPSHEPQDILSGISTTYQKGRHLKPVQEAVPHPDNNILNGTQYLAQTKTVYVEDTRKVPSLAARALLQPNSAGGPDLMAPQPITKTFDLGFLNPDRGSMADPVEGGMVTSGFGWRLDPLNGKRSWHNGVDIKAQEGTPVLAADSGKVTFAGVDKEFGNMVVIEHPNGLQTIYGHNGSLSVKVGDAIDKGTEIATVGSTGRAIGAHLHFEIRKADLPINPEHVLTQYYDMSGSV